MTVSESIKWIENMCLKIRSEQKHEFILGREDLDDRTLAECLFCLKSAGRFESVVGEYLSVAIVVVCERFGVYIFQDDAFYKRGIELLSTYANTRTILEYATSKGRRRNSKRILDKLSRGLESPETSSRIDTRFGQVKLSQENNIAVKNPKRNYSKCKTWKDVMFDNIKKFQGASSVREAFDNPKLCPLMSNSINNSSLGMRFYFPRLKWVVFSEIEGIKMAGMKPVSFPKQSDVWYTRQILDSLEEVPQEMEILMRQYSVIKFPMEMPPVTFAKGLTFVDDTYSPEEEFLLEELISDMYLSTNNKDALHVYSAFKSSLIYPFRSQWPVSTNLPIALAMGIPYLPKGCLATELGNWNNVDHNHKRYLTGFAGKIASKKFAFVGEKGIDDIMGKLLIIKGMEQ